MRIFHIVVFCLVSISISAQQPGATRSDLEKRRLNILEAIKMTQEQLEITKKDKKATLGQLQALQNKLAERQKLISNINQEIGEINRNIQYSSKEISQLKSNLEMLKVRYAQSIRYAYKNRSSYNMIAFLFSSEDFNQAIRRLKYLKKYRDYRKQQADQIRVTQTRIVQKIGVLNSEKSQKDMLLSTEVQQRMVLQKETSEKDKVVKDLKGREAELAGDISKNQKSLRQLEKTIGNLIQREIELAKKREEEERRKEAAERKRREEEQQRSVDAYARNSGISVPARSGNAPASTKTNTPASSGNNRAGSAYNPVALKPGAAPVRSSNPSYKLSLTPEVAALSNNFESNRGRLLWPVE
jgi:septal ring factor EnvC (AmiA/AmiB activator)